MDREIVPAETLLEPPHDGNVATLLERTVTNQPDETAIEHAGERITYRKFDALVDEYARGLRGSGLEVDDRVCLYLPNGIDFCAVVWACCRTGIVASPLNPAYRRREIEYQVDDADAEAIVVDGQPDDHVTAAVADLAAEILSTAETGGDGWGSLSSRADRIAESGPRAESGSKPESESEPEPDDRESLPVDRADDDVLLQSYTSGTTGDPKGVLLTHRNFRVQIANSVSSFSASPFQGDGLIILPMSHITGLLQMLSSLSAGRTLHLLRPDQWDPERVLQLLEDHDIPTFIGVSTMFNDLLEAYEPGAYDLETLERAGQGGDKLPKPV